MEDPLYPVACLDNIAGRGRDFRVKTAVLIRSDKIRIRVGQAGDQDNHSRQHGAGSAGDGRRAVGGGGPDGDQSGDGRRPVHNVHDGQSLVDCRCLEV